MNIGMILIVIGAIGIFLGSGLRKVPAIPPHIGAILRRGALTGEYRESGWTWIVPIKFFEDIEYINIEKRERDLPPEEVRCQDLGKVRIGVSYTWAPDPGNIKAYIKSGKDEEIEKILAVTIQQKMRQFAIAYSYAEVLKTTDVMIGQILADVCGVEEKEALKELAEKKELHDKGVLGIIIYRLNITTIEEVGELAKAAERRIVEEREREGEVYETETELVKAKALIEVASQFNQEISLSKAFEMIMNYKAVREGRGKVWIIPGLSEIPEMIKGFKRTLEE